MPRASTKKPRSKGAKRMEEPLAADGGNGSAPTATAVAETSSDELQPPTKPIETAQAERAEKAEKSEGRSVPDKDRIAASLNIAKLQAMQMTELNTMARELGVENFGTMRKHEVISIFCRRTPSAPVCCFPKACWKCCRKGSVSCGRKASIICRARRTFTFRRRRS